MKIAVLGTGMYVTGRHGSGVGTVLASLLQYAKQVPLELVVFCNRVESMADVHAAMERLIQALHISIEYKVELIEKLHDRCSVDQFDAGIVVLPDHLHAHYAEILLNHKVHTLVVKPLAPTVKEVLGLVETARRSNVIGAVEFHKRFDQQNIYAKDKINELGVINLNYVDVDYSQPLSIPMEVFSSWVHQTNIFQYLGVHYVDLIMHLTGARPTRVSCHGTDGFLKRSGLNAYDSMHASIEWSNGTDKFFSNLNIGWVEANNNPCLSMQRIKFCFAGERIELNQHDRGISHYSAEGLRYPNPYFCQILDVEDNPFLSGYGPDSISRFLDAAGLVNAGKLDLNGAINNFSLATFEESVIVSAVLEAASASAREDGKWITV